MCASSGDDLSRTRGGNGNLIWSELQNFAVGEQDDRVDDTEDLQMNILVDAHVNVYGCYSLPEFLNSAVKNFSAAATELTINHTPARVLLLTESSNEDYFAKFVLWAKNERAQDEWRFELTDEPESIVALNRNGDKLYLLAGRQIRTGEDLEVLVACTHQRIADNKNIADTVAEAADSNSVVILPWGFGKWMGHRARIIDELIENLQHQPVHLGDNSGRVPLVGEPPQFRRIRKQGKFVLRGTDPLPFAGQEKRIGRFGFLVHGDFDPSRPAFSIRQLLHQLEVRPIPYGRLERIMPFVRHQVLLQCRKRGWIGAGVPS